MIDLSEIDAQIMAELDQPEFWRAESEQVRDPSAAELAAAAESMIADLDQMRLDVCLVPQPPEYDSRGGRMIRAVVSRNPEWYRALCSEYQKSRTRPRRGRRAARDTKIDRAATLAALRLIASGGGGTIYAGRLMPHVTDRAKSIIRNEL